MQQRTQTVLAIAAAVIIVIWVAWSAMPGTP